jgi:hypothetical protein
VDLPPVPPWIRPGRGGSVPPMPAGMPDAGAGDALVIVVIIVAIVLVLVIEAGRGTCTVVVYSAMNP